MSHSAPGPDELLGLLDLVYASALEAGDEGEVFRRLKEFLRGDVLQVDIREQETGKLVRSRLTGAIADPDQAVDEYLTDWSERDPRARLLCSRIGGQLMRCHEHFDEAFVRTDPFYQEFLLARGLRWSMGASFANEDGTVTLVIGTRNAQAGPYDSSLEAALRQLLPHLRRARIVRSRASRPPSPLPSVDLFKVLPVPLLLTDSFARNLESNQAFADMAQALSMKSVLGRIRLTDSVLQGNWEKALAETHGTALARSLPLAAAGRQWRVELLPVAVGVALDQRMILAVFLEREAAPAPAGAFPIKARFTRAELEVMAGLMQGLSAKLIATQRGASVNTVRKQIMAILEKSGFKSQRELIAAFGASAFMDSRVGNSAFVDSRLSNSTSLAD